MKLTTQLIGTVPELDVAGPTGALAGRDIHEIVLEAPGRLRARFVSYGATLVSVLAAGRDGAMEEVTLSQDLDSLLHHPRFFGSTVGRYANRICAGRFTLDGVEYSLGINNGPNHLHGGHRGFDKCVWGWTTTEAEDAVAVRFTLHSPDGDEGYPGALDAVVTYTLTRGGELLMDYQATSDKSTPVNLTNHAYWNLSGGHRCGAPDHLLQTHCSRYVVTGDGNIPTGELRGVDGSPFDLRAEGGVRLGERIPLIPGPGDITGFDHCFVVDGAYERNLAGAHNSEDVQLFPAATLHCPLSGRVLQVSTSQPGVQVYTANFLASAPPFSRHNAVCLETQHFPDTINQPAFPSCVLRPGHVYHHRSKFAFSVVA